MRVRSEKNESLFLLTSESERFVIKTSDDGRDRTSSWIKNGTEQAKLSPRSWLHLFFNLRRAQDENLIFIKVSVTQFFFFATTRRQAHWTSWSLLQAKFCSKGTFRLWQSWRRLRATGLICQYQANLKNLNYWTRETQILFLIFKLDETSLEVSKQIDDDRWFDQELCAE